MTVVMSSLETDNAEVSKAKHLTLSIRWEHSRALLETVEVPYSSSLQHIRDLLTTTSHSVLKHRQFAFVFADHIATEEEKFRCRRQ